MIYKQPLKVDSNLFLFLVFLAVIAGLAFGFADVYDHMSNVDVQTYVGLSEFDFDQHPVRRYRIIIPMLASFIYAILGKIFCLLAPNDFPGDFARIFSFVVVNSAMMAAYGVLLFRICQTIVGEDRYWAAMIGVVSVLTCRWTMLISGSALVDSLYLVVLGVLLLGILKDQIGLLILAIYLGPWAKEAFVFLVPLLLFTERKYYPKLLLHLLLSGLLIFSFRYIFDWYIGADMGQSLSRDISHFSEIPKSLKRLFSWHGVYEVLSIGGIWNVFLLIGIFQNKIRRMYRKHFTPLWMLLIVLVVFQALLSTELARMFYLLTPLLAWMVAVSFDRFLSQTKLASRSD